MINSEASHCAAIRSRERDCPVSVERGGRLTPSIFSIVLLRCVHGFSCVVILIGIVVDVVPHMIKCSRRISRLSFSSSSSRPETTRTSTLDLEPEFLRTSEDRFAIPKHRLISCPMLALVSSVPHTVLSSADATEIGSGLVSKIALSLALDSSNDPLAHARISLMTLSGVLLESYQDGRPNFGMIESGPRENGLPMPATPLCRAYMSIAM